MKRTARKETTRLSLARSPTRTVPSSCEPDAPFLAGSGGSSQEIAPGSVLTDTSPLVALDVTVLDKIWNAITSLNKSNFIVYENGEAQVIRNFDAAKLKDIGKLEQLPFATLNLDIPEQKNAKIIRIALRGVAPGKLGATEIELNPAPWLLPLGSVYTASV